MDEKSSALAIQELSSPNSPILGPSTKVLRRWRIIHSFHHALEHDPTGPNATVNFDDPTDSYNSLNWTLRKKLSTTILYGMSSMGETYLSAIYAPAVTSVSQEFLISRTPASYALASLMFRFGLGPFSRLPSQRSTAGNTAHWHPTPSRLSSASAQSRRRMSER